MNEPLPNAAYADQGILIDIVASPAKARIFGRAMLAVFGGFLFVLLLIGASFLPVPWNLAIGIALPMTSLGLIVYGMISERKHCRRLLLEHADLGDLTIPLKYLVEKKPTLLESMLKPKNHFHSLGERFGGRTYRLGSIKDLIPIDPLEVEFEARLLDESDFGFQELEEAATPASMPNSALQEYRNEHRGSVATHKTFRGLRRNVIMAGGWSAILVWTFLAVNAAVRSWLEGRLQIGLFLWLGLLAFCLLGTRRSHSRQQWYLVAGGLVGRCAGWRDDAWSVHVFDRRSSLLIMAAQVQSKMWVAGVSDGVSHGQFQVTPTEAEMLLRCWLSHHNPPGVDRLGDFC